MKFLKIQLVFIALLISTFSYGYHISLQITNPLSLMSKYGGLLETRVGQSSVGLGYTLYNGAYQGAQYKVEYMRFKRIFGSMDYRKKYSENFWYVKALGGDAKYESKALETFGNKSDISLPSKTYIAAGAGVGKRFTMNHFCISINLGLKIAYFTDKIDDNVKEQYNLFYATGPGSIIDLNFRLGYQL